MAFDMTREEALRQLKELGTSKDTEAAHSCADDILMELLKSLGYEDVVAAYDDVPKWYA